MMEYVILAVLIAAAVVAAVVTFSRAVGDSFQVAGQAATAREKTAKETMDKERVRRDNDIKYSQEYHDAMHEVQ